MKRQLQFITKEEGCSLCDDAFEEIESAMDYVDFDMDIVKIRNGDPLWDKYWDKIPVILIDGKRSLADVLEATSAAGIQRADLERLFELELVAATGGGARSLGTEPTQASPLGES